MAAKSEEGINGCSFLWSIENINHCWLDGEDKIFSPTFIAHGIEGTKWTLCLYPMRISCEDELFLYLRRNIDCSGPNCVEVRYQLTILTKDDSSLNIMSESILSFSKGSVSSPKTVSSKTVFLSEREAFIPEDTLTIQCVIWKRSEKPIKPRYLSARTVFKVNRRSFSWKIDEFSTLKPGVRTKFKDDLIDFSLVLNEGLEFGKELVIEGVLLDQRVKYFLFKTRIIDSEDNMTDGGTHEYFASDLKRGIPSTVLFVDELLKDKSRNLPNDVLSLECEYVCSNGTVSYEFCGYGIISPEVTNVTIEKGKL